MKQKIFLFGCLLLVLSLILASCKKKKDDPVTPTPSSVNVESYFEVQNGVLKNATFPTSTSNLALENVQMNQNVLPGGTSYVSFEMPASVDKIYVGVNDVDGYFEITPSSDKNIIYDFIIIMSQEIDDQSFVIQIAVLDENGQVSQTHLVPVELITAGTGQLQISLSFSNEKDVDLHLFEPNGAHIYYGNKRSDNGGELDIDSNAGCWIDSINNENIYYSDSAYIEPGLYSVYVDMWSNCDPSTATNFVLSVFYNGSLIETVTGNNPTVGTFPINEPSNMGDISSIDPVITFEIPDLNAKQPVKKFEPLPLTESAIMKLSMEQK